MGAFDDYLSGPKQPASGGGGAFDAHVQGEPGDTARGFKTAWQQVPQLAYGLAAILASAAETAVGDGGLASAAKNWAVKGYEGWGNDIRANSRATDEFDVSWERAKDGDFGALVDWLQYGVGYAAGQAVQLVATGGVGGAVGKIALKPAVEKVASTWVAKEAERIVADAAAKQGVKLTAEQIAVEAGKDAVRKAAVSNVAGQAGMFAATGAQAFGMEAGEIGGDLAERSVKEGRTLTGTELARAAGATLLAGTFEFAGDALGLGAILGKLPVGKAAAKATGIGGRAARAATAAPLAAAGEGATEYMQTGAEEWGKGKESSIFPWEQSEEAQRQALNAAALGAVGGAAMGAGGGALSSPQAPDQPAARTDDIRRDTERKLAGIDAAKTVEGAVAAALGDEVTMADVADWDGGIVSSRMAGIGESAARAGLAEPAYAARAAELEAAKARDLQAMLDQDRTIAADAATAASLRMESEAAPPVASGEAPKTAMQIAFEKAVLKRMEAMVASGVLDQAPDVAEAPSAPAAPASTPATPGLAQTPTGQPQEAGAAPVSAVTAPAPAAPQSQSGFVPAGVARGALPAWAPVPTGWRKKWTTLEVESGKWRIAGRNNLNPISPAFATEREAEAWADAQEAPPPAAPAAERAAIPPSAPSGTANTAVGNSASKQAENGTKQAQNTQNSPSVPVAATVDVAASKAATSPQNALPEPTEAQKEAGNYTKGHARVAGLDVSIENPAGSKRRPEWPTLKQHYGYVKGSVGMDKDHLDVFVKPGTPEDWKGTVYVVNQKKDDGRPDEHKAMVGFDSREAARAAYLENYTAGWEKNIDSVVPIRSDKFTAWATDKSKAGPAGGFLKSGSPAVRIMGQSVHAMTEKALKAIEAPLQKKVAAGGRLTPKQREQLDAAREELDRRAEERAAKPMSPAEAARREKLKRDAAERKAVDIEKDSLIPAIIKLGGLKDTERMDIIRNDTGNRGIPGVGSLFTKKGMESDAMAIELAQYGYLTAEEMGDVDGGVRALKDKVAEEFDGQRTHWSVNAEAPLRERQRLDAEAAEDAEKAEAAERAAAGAGLDFAIDPAELADDGMPNDANTLAIAELVARAAAIDEGAVEAMAERAESDAAYKAALLQFLKERENAPVRADAQDQRVRQEEGEGSRVPEGDRAPAKETGANQSAATSGEVVRIPVVFGRNRLRGKSQGAMVDDFGGETLDRLRVTLRDEARAQGFEPTPEWITKAVSSILRMYEDGFRQWQAAKGETIGFVFEGSLPSGKRLLLAEQRTLGRVSDAAAAEAREETGPAEVAPRGAPPARAQRLFIIWNGNRREVASLEDAAAKWDTFRDATGAGASEIGGNAKVVDQDGTEVARISYNGRVWPPGEYKPGQKPLVPDGHDEALAARVRDGRAANRGAVVDGEVVEGERVEFTQEIGPGEKIPAEGLQRLRAAVADLPRDGIAIGEFRRMPLYQDGTPEIVFEAAVSNGDGTATMVGPWFETLPTEGQILEQANDRRARDAQTAEKRDTAIRERLARIKELGLEEGGTWSDAEAYVEGRGKAGRKKFSLATITKIEENGIVHVRAILPGSRAPYEFKTGPDSRLFDNYPKRPALDLKPQTPEELRAREKALADAEQKRADEAAAAEAKAAADRDRANFTLTGSTRAADANPGQGDMFGAVQRPAEPANPIADAADALAKAAEALKAAVQPQPSTVERNVEQAIRDAANAVRGRVVGSWYPITVQYGGRTQQFLSNIKRVVSDGRTIPSISLVQIRPGRLLRGDPAEPLFYGYRLTGKNELVDEGVPRRPSERELERWNQAFGSGDAAPSEEIADVGNNRLTRAIQNPEQRSATPEAESQAPAPSEPGDRGVAPARGGAVQDGRIVDVGENLWYNRRNRTARALGWGDVKDLNDALKVKEVVKAKVWPKPNYEQLIADGMQPFFARMLKKVYDGIATAPTKRTDADLEAYIAIVNRVKEAVFDWAKDNNQNKDFAAAMAEQAKQRLERRFFVASAASNASIRDVILERVWPVATDRPMRRFGPGTQELTEIRLIGGQRALDALRFSLDDAAKAMKDISEGWPTPQESWQRQGYQIVPRSALEIRSSGVENRKALYVNDRYSNSVPATATMESIFPADAQWFVVSKRRDIEGWAEAEDKAKGVARDLVKREGKGGEIRGMNIGKAERTGPERRASGENISPERLMDEFGFRGVNFGREGWINQAERQAYLNHAYDGLLDLAELLDVPPKALSLNGMLGIAFGAQGRGGQHAAHFVPGVNEINLTKTMGAGTLAHEWGHALDHYFATLAGLAKSGEPFLSEHTTDPRGNADIRPEILQAFKDVVDAMEKRPMTEAEMQAQEKMAEKGARDTMETWVQHFRKGIERVAPGVLPEFDTLAERLRNGDLGDGYTKAFGQDLHKVVADIKVLVRTKAKSSGVDVASNYKGLDATASHLAFRLKQGEATKAHVPQTTSTTYAGESSAKDRDKGGKAYWRTRLEMFARAFETWVADRLAAKAQENTFLSDAALRAEAKSRDGKGYAMPYPRGEDRQRINEAMGKLVDAIETKSTERGVAMFSRSAPVAYTTDAKGRPELGGNGITLAEAAYWQTMFGQRIYQSKILADGKHVGHITLGWKDGRVASLMNIEFADEHQGKGYGEAAVKSILQHNGDAELHVMNILPKARGFWMKMGTEPFQTEVGEDGVLTEKAYLAARGDQGDPQESGRDALRQGADAGVEGRNGETRFRREGQGQALGLTAADVRGIIAPVLKGWGNAPTVEVLSSMADSRVPARVREEYERQQEGGAQGEPEGFIHNGKVYLVASALKSPWSVYRVLFHEALGHAGLRGAFGMELQVILEDVVRSMPTRVRQKARQYGLDWNNADDRLMAAEEVLAELAQTRPNANIVKRAIAAIRQFLREIGIDLKLSDNDIVAQFILPARAFVEGQQAQARGESMEPVFGRDPLKSDEFRRWFGDSKVVNSDGRPKVVYHGTDVDFGEFDTTDFGSWFAETPDGTEPHNSKGADGSPRTIPVYLSITKPFEIPEEINLNDDVILEDALKVLNEANGTNIAPEEIGYGDNPRYDGTAFQWIAMDERFIEAVRKRGFDGMHAYEGTEETWNAFRPEQIKSVFNRGAFDPNDARIGYSREQRDKALGGMPMFSRRGGLEHVGDIGADLAGKIGREAGKIVLTTEGVKHIDQRRGDRLRKEWGSVRAFVRYVAKNFNMVYEVSGRQLLLVRANGRPDFMFVQLAPMADRAGYEVRTAYTAEPRELARQEGKGARLLMDARGKASRETGNPTPFAGAPSDITGDGSTNAQGQSSDGIVRGGGGPIKGPQAPAFSRSPSGNATSWDAPMPSRLDDLIYVMQDKQVDTRRVLEQIRKQAAVADPQDVRLQEELYHGRTAKHVDDFLAKELKPLVTEMAARKVTMAELEEYLHARHAEERNEQIARINPNLPDGGSGMDTADARAYLAGLDPAKKRAYEALATRVDAINAKTRQTLVDYGLESQATMDAWEQAYQHYVPLHREDMDGGPGTGQGFSVRGPAAKRATGSKRAVVDILANVAAQREKAIVRGEKNRVAVALVGLAESNPNADFWTVDDPPTIKYVDDRTGLVTEAVDPLFKSRDNVVMARVPDASGNVVERSVTFNEFDERAMRMAKALKNLDMDDLGHVLGVSAKITRYFASVNTQYNPVFGVVNLVRDVQGALFNLSTTAIAGKQADVAKHTLSALRGIYIDTRDTRQGKPATSAWAQLWEEFQDVGGKTGYRDMFRTSKDRAEAIEREIGKVTEGKAKQMGRAVFDWLSDYNTAMENAVRLAAYKVGIENGMTKERAASMAKNLTVNFNRKGQIATQAGALYAFFNASVQGTARLAETLAGPMGRQIIAGGLTLGAIQALLLAAAGFDDNEPPEFVRERNIVIPIGDKKYLTIPMPLGLHVLPNVSRIATEFALGGFRDPGKKVAQIAGVFAEAFNPVGNAGLSLQTIAPTAIDPLAALAENRDWTGKPIAREDMNKLAPTPGHTRAKDVASAFSKAVSKGLNWMTGGTNYKPGFFSPTPDQIDYLIGQATGGIGREAMKAEQTVLSAFSGEDLPTHKVPLLGRLYGDASQQSSQANTFYENLKKLNEHEAEIKGRRKHGEPIGDYFRENPEARLFQMANKYERVVSELRKQRRALIEKDAPKEQIRAIDDRIKMQMQSFNGRVKAATEARAG